MAESVLKDMVNKNPELNWEVDSAALRNWNVGYSPEERCIAVLQENGLTSNHIGREIGLVDFNRFDYIFGMDDWNLEELQALAPSNCKARIELLGTYSMSNDKIISDPYFETGIHGFQRCYDQITKCCSNFIDLKLKEIRN